MTVNKKEIVRRTLVLAYVTLLNALVIVRYWHQFSYLNDNYRKLVLNTFHISGFDPLSYIVIDRWTTAYNIYRHPLLAFFMWLPSQHPRSLRLLHLYIYGASAPSCRRHR